MTHEKKPMEAKPLRVDQKKALELMATTASRWLRTIAAEGIAVPEAASSLRDAIAAIERAFASPA